MSASTVVHGVWSGEYSGRRLHAVFSTRELAEQYVKDFSPGHYEAYEIEPEDLFTDRAQWLFDLQEQRRKEDESRVRASAAEKERKELAVRVATEADRRAVLIREVVGVPHRITPAQIVAEMADVPPRVSGV